MADHGGWAILVTATADGTLLDRRRVELLDADLPRLPHHVEGQGLPTAEAVALVERVRASAERQARILLGEMERALPGRVGGLALRRCPPLPPTVADRLTDYRARNVADWVMYRQAWAAAAGERGWRVDWYDARTVFEPEGARSEAALRERRKWIGPPWDRDHRVAMALAMAAACSWGAAGA
jgi:hypothetical protein